MYAMGPGKIRCNYRSYVCFAKGEANVYLEMGNFFHPTLILVQGKYLNVISDSVNIVDKYSIYRCCGATLEALNKGILKTIINMNNKWRKELRANEITPSMSMLQWCMDAEVTIPTLTQYSSMLPE